MNINPTGGGSAGERIYMYDKIEQRISEIYDRLDNLEGCEDNPVYTEEIKSLCQELIELNAFMATEFF